MDFEVLINTKFADFNVDVSLQPIQNKNVLSVTNDYEDGEWMYKKFSLFVWDNIAETALSHRERNSLINQSLLGYAAKNLRLSDGEKDPTKGSELAEILLYGLMKHHYGALPVVPKIFYKQNSQDFAKGADSVHIVIENDTDFSIWFGEAKFYNSIEDARLDAILDSVKNSLQTEKLKKENSIITNLNELDLLVDDTNLVERIKASLCNGTSLDHLKCRLHVPILLLHECEITKSANASTGAFKEKLISKHKERAQIYFEKQISKLKTEIFKYEEIKFHLIFFPVPSKETITKTFIENITFHKGQV